MHLYHPCALCRTDAVIQDITDAVIQDITDAVIQDISDAVIQDITDAVIQDIGSALCVSLSGTEVGYAGTRRRAIRCGCS
eukprot:441495-Rhodomonas_salina.4